MLLCFLGFLSWVVRPEAAWGGKGLFLPTLLGNMCIMDRNQVRQSRHGLGCRTEDEAMEEC